MVALIGVAWLPSVIVASHRFRQVRWPLILSGLLVAYATISLLNDRSTFDASRDRLASLPSVAWLPGVVDQRNALASLASVFAGLAILVIVTDVGQSDRWRGRLLGAIACGGLTTALIGLLEATPILSDIKAWLAASSWSDAHPFGLFTYHNSAAVMMNVAVPALAALALRRHPTVGRRFAASVCIGVIGTAVTFNISRTGLVLFAIVALVSLMILWWPARSISTGLTRLVSIVACVIALIVPATLLILARPALMQRFENVHERWGTYYPRYLQAKAAIELIEKAPVFGHGAGSYRMLACETSLRGMFLAPHYRPGQPFTSVLTVTNDYLQTLLEWGIAGTLLFAAILCGGVVASFVALRSASLRSGRRELLLVLCAAFAVFAHAVVDCPLQIPSLQMTAAVLVGLLWAAPRWRSSWADPLAAFYD
jgi:O-antigen ligase